MKTITKFQAEVDAHVSRAAALAGPHDAKAVAAFCAELLGKRSKDEIAADLRGMRLPSGFIHVRAFDAATGAYVSGAYSTTHQPTEAIGVLGCALAIVGGDVGNWVETIPLPVAAPGVLDVAIRYAVPPALWLGRRD